jgi:alanine dehydrogenase
VSELLFLSREEVASLLPGLGDQLDLVETTYQALAAGRVELPPKPGIHARPDAFIHAMPAYLEDNDIAGLKWVSGYPANRELGLPYISGLIVLNDAATGLPVAVMDGAEITAARTAAASGTCIRRFAPAGWRRAAILGCGEQGRFHARVLAELNPGVEIRGYDPEPARAAEVSRKAKPADTWQEAVAGADVVVTAGPIVDDPDSPLAPDHLGDRWLLLPLDFDFYAGAAAVAAADLFAVDDVDQFEYYRGRGHFRDWPAPVATVGSALGDASRPDRVACVNLGVGALDVGFAASVLAAAREQDVGTRLAL